MLTLQNVSYIHPNKDLLFSNISLTLGDREKIALVGNNGVGKSTLLKILAKELLPSGGEMTMSTVALYIPQVFGQFNNLTVAAALKVDLKLAAYQAILNGDTSTENFGVLNDDWTIEDRCYESLAHWQLGHLKLSDRMADLSGGQKTKVFLAGISIHQPNMILLDEPSNHLDHAGRTLLYDLLLQTKSSLIVISHDRKLLNLFETVCEMTATGIKVYGGNFEFYKEQKTLEANSLANHIQSQEKELKRAKQKERETLEREQKLDSRGKGKQEKSGVARIMMNTLRNSAENSTAKLKSVHAEKVGGIRKELLDLRSLVPETDQMKFGFDSSVLNMGKVLFKAEHINVMFDKGIGVWKNKQSFELLSGERIALTGNNGSGKTTMIKVMMGQVIPQIGSIQTAMKKMVYVDQEYSLIGGTLSIYEQAQHYNASALPEHEIKIRLHRFLFTKDDWDKSCNQLSGGERMRLVLCCLNINSQAPDIIILDEPTNNLDIQNIEILTSVIKDYQGTLVVVSHDETFLQEINIQKVIAL